MSMNITALVNSVRMEDWTKELVVIANNDGPSKKANDYVFQKNKRPWQEAKPLFTNKESKQHIHCEFGAFFVSIAQSVLSDQCHSVNLGNSGNLINHPNLHENARSDRIVFTPKNPIK